MEISRLTWCLVGTGVDIGIWSCVEVSLDVISCNIPATTPLFIAVGEKLLGWKSKRKGEGGASGLLSFRRRRVYDGRWRDFERRNKHWVSQGFESVCDNVEWNADSITVDVASIQRDVSRSLFGGDEG